MLFKLETKETYHIISTNFESLDEIMTDGLTEYIKQNDSSLQNYIIDLNTVQHFDIKATNGLIALHDYVYHTLGGSIVFTLIQNNVLQTIKQERLHLTINITPTVIEAEDIINMEVLERDLLGEEE